VLKRLWHSIIGHTFLSGTFCYLAGTGRMDCGLSMNNTADIRKVHGFTEFCLICSCGKVNKFAVNGKHRIERAPQDRQDTAATQASAAPEAT